MEIILSHGATMPKRGTDRSSGLDLEARGYKRSDLDTVWFDDQHTLPCCLSSGERILIKTGIQLNIPFQNHEFLLEAQIRPRSGLAFKKGITVLNSPGTIDQDFRGEIGVLLHNTSDFPFYINEGDRIAQLVFSYVPRFDVDSFDIVESFTEYKSERGKDGFGSTGV